MYRQIARLFRRAAYQLFEPVAGGARVVGSAYAPVPLQVKVFLQVVKKVVTGHHAPVKKYLLIQSSSLFTSNK